MRAINLPTSISLVPGDGILKLMAPKTCLLMLNRIQLRNKGANPLEGETKLVEDKAVIDES